MGVGSGEWVEVVAGSGLRALGGQVAALPRHVAMAPSPSHLPTAFPKSVHSRATHDDGGAPPLATACAAHFVRGICRHGRDALPRVRCHHAVFGRAGARPSRDTWRWRPRHRICQPPSRNQSIPAQRTTTGASPPRQIRKCPNGQTQSQAENHESQIHTASCQLPTAKSERGRPSGIPS